MNAKDGAKTALHVRPGGCEKLGGASELKPVLGFRFVRVSDAGTTVSCFTFCSGSIFAHTYTHVDIGVCAACSDIAELAR